jgi:hypothetical protein
MELSRFVGVTFVKHLTDATHFPLLVIGKDRWSFAEVAALGIIHPRACRIVSKLAATLKVRDAKDLYKQTSPYMLAGEVGCGVTSLFVLLRVFDALGLNANAWYVRGEKAAVRTFETLKHREQLAERRTLEGERKRRRLRSTRDVVPAAHATH